MSNISFFQQLEDILNNDSDENNNETNEDICLIDFAPLTENFVRLSCGHTFNYGPLYRDVVEALKMNRKSRVIGSGVIRCPFCRSLHHGLLPVVPGYRVLPNVNKIPEVKLVKCKPKLKSNPNPELIHNCQYTFKSGKNKGCLCNKLTTNALFCSTHISKKNYLCCGILKSGKNAGQYCTVPVVKNGDFCSIHSEKVI